MPANNTYLQFVQEIKQEILESRYQAARLVNKELLLLYYNIGKMLNQKIRQAKWGDKVLQSISADLQKKLPGLKGFSQRSLKKMRQFYEEYRQLPIGPLSTAQLQSASKKLLVTDQPEKSEKEPLITAQINTWASQTVNSSEQLYGVSFTCTDSGTAVGTTGTILHTTNGGKKWNPEMSGTTQTLNRVAFYNAKKGFAVGNGGTGFTYQWIKK